MKEPKYKIIKVDPEIYTSADKIAKSLDINVEELVKQALVVYSCKVLEEKIKENL